jgi:hypothetical protein
MRPPPSLRPWRSLRETFLRIIKRFRFPHATAAKVAKVHPNSALDSKPNPTRPPPSLRPWRSLRETFLCIIKRFRFPHATAAKVAKVHPNSVVDSKPNPMRPPPSLRPWRSLRETFLRIIKRFRFPHATAAKVAKVHPNSVVDSKPNPTRPPPSLRPWRSLRETFLRIIKRFRFPHATAAKVAKVHPNSALDSKPNPKPNPTRPPPSLRPWRSLRETFLRIIKRFRFPHATAAKARQGSPELSRGLETESNASPAFFAPPPSLRPWRSLRETFLCIIKRFHFPHATAAKVAKVHPNSALDSKPNPTRPPPSLASLAFFA